MHFHVHLGGSNVPDGRIVTATAAPGVSVRMKRASYDIDGNIPSMSTLQHMYVRRAGTSSLFPTGLTS